MNMICSECPDVDCFLQSILWKRSGSSLNKEWKKKYVTLSNNGTLSYHSNSSVREHHRPDQYCSKTQKRSTKILYLVTWVTMGEDEFKGP